MQVIFDYLHCISDMLMGTATFCISLLPGESHNCPRQEEF